MRESERYTFGPFALDVSERKLSTGGVALPLAPKALDLLVALVRRAGRLVTKQELLDVVWPDAIVEEGILAVHISALRKALGTRGAPCIETVPRSGYRFVAPLVPTHAVTSKRPPSPGRSPEVCELVGRGRAHLLSASMFDLPKAVGAFQRAVDLDPTYAAAYAGLALTWCAHAELRLLSHAEAYDRAKAAALRALGLDNRSVDAQVALGTVLFFSEWDWTGAERCFRRALDLSPDHTQASLLYGRLLEALGCVDEALAVKMHALERDPLSPAVPLQIAVTYWHLRQYDESIEWANRALALDPNLLPAREHLAGAYWKKGDLDRMMRENVEQAEAYGAATGTLDAVRALCQTMMKVYAEGGRPAVVRFALKQADANPGPAVAIQRAVLAAEAGEFDAAFAHLDEAIAHHDPCLVNLAVAPQWDPLRADSRFAVHLARMGLAAPAQTAHPATPQLTTDVRSDI